MTTAKQPPSTRYDAEIAANGLYHVDRPLLYRREGYLAALADLAPLHRQLVGALESVVEAVRCPTCEDGECGVLWHGHITAALDAARKAGL